MQVSTVGPCLLGLLSLPTVEAHYGPLQHLELYFPCFKTNVAAATGSVSFWLSTTILLRPTGFRSFAQAPEGLGLDLTERWGTDLNFKFWNQLQ